MARQRLREGALKRPCVLDSRTCSSITVPLCCVLLPSTPTVLKMVKILLSLAVMALRTNTHKHTQQRRGNSGRRLLATDTIRCCCACCQSPLSCWDPLLTTTRTSTQSRRRTSRRVVPRVSHSEAQHRPPLPFRSRPCRETRLNVVQLLPRA